MSRQAFAVAGSQPLQQLLSWSSSCAGFSPITGLVSTCGAGWGAVCVAEDFWARKRPGKLLLISLFNCSSCSGSAHRVCPRCRKMLQCVMTEGCTSAGAALCHLHLSLCLLEDWAGFCPHTTQLVCGHLTANLSMMWILLRRWLRNSCSPSSLAVWCHHFPQPSHGVCVCGDVCASTPSSS